MSIDRLRAHWGFTRTPFSKELAPAMLFAPPRPPGGRRADRVDRQRARARRDQRRGRRRQDRRRPRRHQRAWTPAATRSSTSPNPAVGRAGSTPQIVTGLGGTPRFHKRDADPAGRRPARRRSRRARQDRRADPRRSPPARGRAARGAADADQRRAWTPTPPFACLLLGQPTLRRQLRQGVFAALDQRIALRYTIDGMDRQETGDYLAHHLKLAGRSDTLFSDDAVALIHEASRGLPRLVNNLAIQSLIAAFADNKAIVDETRRPRRRRRGLRRMTASRLLITSHAGAGPAPRSPPPAGWPAPPAQAAYHRPGRRDRRDDRAAHRGRPGRHPRPTAGRVRRRRGRGAWFTVEATRHHPNEFPSSSATAPRPARAPPGITSPGSCQVSIRASRRG